MLDCKPVSFFRNITDPLASSTQTEEYEENKKKALLSAAIAAAASAGLYVMRKPAPPVRTVSKLSPTVRNALSAATLLGTIGVPIAAYSALNDSADRRRVASAGIGLSALAGGYQARGNGLSFTQGARQVGKTALLGASLTAGTDALRSALQAYKLFNVQDSSQT